ncbi:hypothetical protein INR49_032554, partial [Caranx melampygus]
MNGGRASGGKRGRDSVGVRRTEWGLRFKLKADVYKGCSRRLRLLHSSRIRSVLLTSPLLCHPALGL